MLRVKLSNGVMSVIEETPAMRELVKMCLKVYEENFFGKVRYFATAGDCDIVGICPYRHISRGVYDVCVRIVPIDVLPEEQEIILI